MNFLNILQSMQDTRGAQEEDEFNSQDQLAKLLGFQQEADELAVGGRAGPTFGGGNQGQEGGVLSFSNSDENVDPRTIEVSANNPQRERMQAPSNDEPLNLGNADILAEAQAAGENAPQRKRGYFGTKGTLRNILGTLSDAFLVQGGADAQYAPLRERERRADAMTGYTQNPQAAAERMAYQGFAEDSTKLWNDTQVNKVNQGNLQARQGEGERKAVVDADKRYEDFSKVFSQYAGSSTPETYERIKPILQALKKRGGLGDEFIIPDTYEPELMRTYQFGGMPAQQQVRSEDKNEDQAWDREKFGRAEAGRMARDNPPAGRNPPRPESESEYKARIRAKIGQGTATQAEIDSLSVGSGRGNRASGRREVTPPNKFQGWKIRPK